MTRRYASDEVLNLETGIGNFEYVIQQPDEATPPDDTFPAQVVRGRRSGRFIVYLDKDAIMPLRRNYVSSGLTVEAVDLLHVGTGIVDQAALRKASALEDPEAFFATMSSADDICRQVLDESPPELAEKLIPYLHDELSPQIARINGLRFATRTLVDSYPTHLRHLQSEALPHLSDRFLLAEPQFIRIARAFTNNVFQARESFAETVPLHEIAFSFPMSSPQYDTATSLLSQ